LPALVIVGASLAGLRAAQGARRGGWEGEIVVVGEERHMPYARPPLSKELLTDAAQGVGDHLLPAELEATWLLGKRASGLDRRARRVALAGGEELAYERLVIATGCEPRRWAGPGAELAGVHTIRRAEDALALRAALAGAERVAILGAGFIGCEVAASARALGLEVSLFELASTPLPVLGPDLGERCAALHRAHGVVLRLGTGIASLRGAGGRVVAVELADGTVLDADLVVVALGAVPGTGWLAESGLALEPGVRCDVTLTAVGDPDVLAAGDVAAWPYPLAGKGLIRVEHWTNAAEQGSLAGRNAVLAPAARETFGGVPSFWSDQYGVRIQAVGLPALAQRMHLIEESEDGSRFVAVGERDGRAVGAVAFDGARRLPHYRRLIGEPLDLDALLAAIADDRHALQNRPTTATARTT
jgi:NADPH-dependent 2,4-dienoyl-CoA reductase/sulfur reductase-like enzyme